MKKKVKKGAVIAVVFLLIITLYSFGVIQLIGHAIFDAKVTSSILSMGIDIAETENNVVVGSGGNLSFNNSYIDDIVYNITGLGPGWRANLSMYGSTFPHSWTEREPNSSELNTTFYYFSLNIDNRTVGDYYIFYKLNQSKIGVVLPANISIFRYNSTSNIWEGLDTTIINSTSDPARFYSITHQFSKFVIGERVEINTTNGTGTTEGGSSGSSGGSSGGSVSSVGKGALFDIIISVPDKYHVIAPGDELVLQVSVIDVKEVGVVDVFLDYTIKDLNGKVILRESETRAVKGDLDFFKEMRLPKTIEEGIYVIEVKVRYGDEVVTSSHQFEVSKDTGEHERQVIYIEDDNKYFLGVVFLMFLIMIVYLIFDHKRIKEEIKKSGKKRLLSKDLKRKGYIKTKRRGK